MDFPDWFLGDCIWLPHGKPAMDRSQSECGIATRSYRWSSGGEAICSRSFVNDAFMNARERCGKNRKTGAKKLRGAASPADGLLCSLRDLGKEITRPAIFTSSDPDVRQCDRLGFSRDLRG